MNNASETSKQAPKNYLDSVIPQEKRDAIGRDAKWTSIALAVITLLGQQVLLNMDGVKTLYSIPANALKPGVGSFEDYINIGHVFWQSAPVIIAFAIIFIFVNNQRQKQAGFALGHFFVAAILLVGAGYIGNALGFAPVKTALYNENPYASFAMVLVDIFTSYGVILFLSSLVVGFFMARVWKHLSTDQQQAI